MQAYHILYRMIESKLTVIIRGNSRDMAAKTAQACVEGSIKTLEVTFTVPDGFY